MVDDKRPVPDQRDIWRAITNVEKSTERTAGILTGVVESLKDMKGSAQRDYENLDKRISADNQTQWPAIKTVGGFAITFLLIVLGLGAYTYTTALAALDDRLSSIGQLIIKHEGDNHPEYVIERVLALKETVHTLEEAMKVVVPRAEHDKREELLNQRLDAEKARLSDHIADATRAQEAGKDDLNRSDDQIFERIRRMEDVLYNGR